MSEVYNGWLCIPKSKGSWQLYIPNKKSLAAFQNSTNVLAQIGALQTNKRLPLLNHKPSSSHWITSRIFLSGQSQASNPLKVGPLIGILTVKGRKKKLFSGRPKSYADLIRVGEKLGGLVYVIPCEEINWNTKTAIGYVYNKNSKRWHRLTMPFPDIVYNRIPSREVENKPEINKALQRLSATSGVTLFNKGFFNKWDLYHSLSQKPSLASSLPETHSLKSEQIFQEMINKHPLLYLKPVNGKAGKGIMRLDKIDKTYRLQIRKGRQVLHRTYIDRNDLWKATKRLIKGRPYVIQQGIPLAKYKGSPFDVRILMQKNGQGKLTLTGIGIRVAGKNSITTHVPSGGRIASPQRVLTSAFGKEQLPSLLAKIKKTATQLSLELDQQFGPIGETSMDIGIDRKGKLWFFEANAKPMKFDEPKIRKRSLHKLIAYSQYLGGFPTAKK